MMDALRNKSQYVGALLNFDHLPAGFFERLTSCIETHVEIFSKNAYDVAKIKDFEIDIDLDETKLDLSTRSIPIPYKLKEEVKLNLDQFLKSGIVEPFKGFRPIISNLMCIKKPALKHPKSGPSYRLVGGLKAP